MAEKVIIKRKKITIPLPMYIEPEQFLSKNRKTIEKVRIYTNKKGKVCVSVRTKLSEKQIEKLFS